MPFKMYTISGYYTMVSELCSCGNESKYCCPACKTRTCSLKCVKSHKLERNCTGVAEKTSFVKLSDFDNIQLISDYKFLENIKESIENSQRQLAGNFRGQNTQGVIRKKCLTNNTLIKFMPFGLSRHKLNKTCFKDEVIRWTIELIFSDSCTKIFALDIPETWTILDLIEKYKSDSVPYSEYRFVSMYFKNDPKVSYFIQADIGEANTFHLLDPELMIMESLKFKTVIEYPTIYITTKPASFKSVECQSFDVKARMIQLGLLNGGKRKRTSRKRSYKRQKRGKNKNNNDTDEEGCKKIDVDECDNANESQKTVDIKNDSFKNSVLALFGDEKEDPPVRDLDSDKPKLACSESEEEGEILC